MRSLAEQIAEAGRTGELAPWKAALLAAWLTREGETAVGGPTAEDLALLLTDPEVLRALKKEADGPWDVLAAQARSLLSHGHVGDALFDLGDK